MKKILLSIIILSTFACSKEAVLEPEIEAVNYFVITDDVNDSIQHKRYELYTEYGVPVYFNDTIAVVPDGVDYFGNPVHRVETIDLRWKFESSDRNIYTYEYINSDEEKMEMLNLVEDYLKTAKKAIYPFSVLAVKKLTKKDEDRGSVTEVKFGHFEVFFRSLLMTNDWGKKDTSTGVVLKENVPKEIKLQITRQKIKNYSTHLLMFNVVSKSEWYDVSWSVLDNTLPAGFNTAGLLDEEYWINSELGWGSTMEEIREMQAEKRRAIAAFGFVTGRPNLSYWSPYDYDDDVDGFLKQMLRMSKKEFIELYGGFPLVMKKANVLYDILENEIDLYL